MALKANKDGAISAAQTTVVVNEAVPTFPPSLENTILTVNLIPNDPRNKREVPLYSCIRKCSAGEMNTSSQALFISTLAYDQLISNMSLVWQHERGGRVIVYVPPGHGEFRHIDSDSSFQAAVMRMRNAKYEDILLFEIEGCRE